MTEKLRNRFLPMLVGLIFIVAGTLPLAFLNSDNSIRYLVYPLSFIQGQGLIIMLNTSTSLISDVIGNDSENAAFVYGVYGLFDKAANGLILYFVVEAYSEDHPTELKWIFATVPIGGALFAFALSYYGHKFFSHKLAKITGPKK